MREAENIKENARNSKVEENAENWSIQYVMQHALIDEQK